MFSIFNKDSVILSELATWLRAKHIKKPLLCCSLAFFFGWFFCKAQPHRFIYPHPLSKVKFFGVEVFHASVDYLIGKAGELPAGLESLPGSRGFIWLH